MRAVLIALAVMVSGTAWGAPDDFPIVGVDKNCSRFTSKLILDECIRKEQYYYDLSKDAWPNLPPNSKRKIRFWENPNSTVDATSPTFYQMLWLLIDREMTIAAQKQIETAPAPRFRY